MKLLVALSALAVPAAAGADLQPRQTTTAPPTGTSECPALLASWYSAQPQQPAAFLSWQSAVTSTWDDVGRCRGVAAPQTIASLYASWLAERGSWVAARTSEAISLRSRCSDLISTQSQSDWSVFSSKESYCSTRFPRSSSVTTTSSTGLVTTTSPSRSGSTGSTGTGASATSSGNATSTSVGGSGAGVSGVRVGMVAGMAVAVGLVCLV